MMMMMMMMTTRLMMLMLMSNEDAGDLELLSLLRSVRSRSPIESLAGLSLVLPATRIASAINPKPKP